MTVLSEFEPQVLVRLALEKCRRDGLRSLPTAATRQAKQFLVRKRVFETLTRVRYASQRRRYGAPAHPYKVVTVPLDRINRFNEAIDTHWGLGLVRGGEWDCPENSTPVTETTHYRSLEQRFSEGLDWEETVYYRERLRNDLLDEVPPHKERRLEYFKRLYWDIRDNGYQPNYVSSHDAPEGGARQGQLRHVHALEPLVTIGRNGAVYLNEGFHRVAIAKFLDVERIPVQVLARHRQWQNFREQLEAGSRPSGDLEPAEFPSHPDLNDLLPESQPGSRTIASGRGTVRVDC